MIQTTEDLEVIKRVVKALVQGHWLKGEFSTRVGRFKSEVESVARGLRIQVELSEEERIVVNAMLREMAAGVRATPEELNEWVGVSKQNLKDLHEDIFGR